MTARAGIIWLASFPKSGNTWFRIFLANLAAGENGPADINDLDERGGIASSRHEFEAATLLDFGLISHDDVDRAAAARLPADRRGGDSAQRWIKVHDAYTVLPRTASRCSVAMRRAPQFTWSATRATSPYRSPTTTARRSMTP